MTRPPLALWVLCFIPIAAHSQARVSAAAPGNCSTAIAGGNNNQVVIHCSGVSDARANQLIQLMNRILSEHMDISEVNSRLDQISAQVGSVNTQMSSLNDQMGDLNDTLNPLSKAPASVKKLLFESQSAGQACMMFAMNWMAKDSTARSSAQMAMLRNVPGLPGAAPDPAAAEFNRQKLEAYQNTLEPQIAALIAHFRSVLPPDTSFPDPQSVQGARDVMELERQLQNLYSRYMLVQRSKGSALDSRLVLDWDRVTNACSDSYRSWGKGYPVSTQQRYNQNLKAGDDQVAEIDAQQAQLYQQTLAQRLVAWRSEVVTKLPPQKTQEVDYTSVATYLQLRDVCTDFQSLGSAYRDKAYADLHKP